MQDRPQRFPMLTPLGALSKRLVAAHERLSLRRGHGRAPTYLARVRLLPCLACGVEPAGVAAHVRRQSGTFGKHGGMGIKPQDKWVVPLCHGCHTLDPNSQHRVGEVLFWARIGLNPLLVAERLYAQRDDLVAMRAVVLVAISERKTTG